MANNSRSQSSYRHCISLPLFANNFMCSQTDSNIQAVSKTSHGDKSCQYIVVLAACAVTKSTITTTINGEDMDLHLYCILIYLWILSVSMIQKVNQSSRHADLCRSADWLGSAGFCWVWMEFGGNLIGNKIRVIRQMLPLSVAATIDFGIVSRSFRKIVRSMVMIIHSTIMSRQSC